jgi:hypothetical protein
MFYTILIVMDQQITAVIINRRDNKLRVCLMAVPQVNPHTYLEHYPPSLLLQKGGGYHLDLLIVAILVLICSLLGLPFYVAATVLSVMHVEVISFNFSHFVPMD